MIRTRTLLRKSLRGYILTKTRLYTMEDTMYAKGTRVSYRRGNTVTTGTIVRVESNQPFSEIVYLVKHDASGRCVLVLPQYITAAY